MWNLIPFENHRNVLDRYFNDFERSFFDDAPKGCPAMRTDVIDAGDSYHLKCEMPGFSKEEIRLDVDGEYLTVSAERKEENKQDEKNFLRREIFCGSVKRSFDISNVKADQINAEYKNGVLEITLPKLSQQKPQTRQIEIK